jgi:hypothetical protein
MNALIIGLLGFAAGVIFSDTVRKMVPIEIPSFYANTYQSRQYPSTRSAFTGSVYEKEYDNEMETHLNHITIE